MTTTVTIEDLILLREYRRRSTERQVSLSFRDFIRLANPRYEFYRHCDELIDVLQKVADGEIKRLMVFMPPRHGKSELVSRLFPAYYLHRHPSKWVAIASYGADLAYTLSRAARENYTRAGNALHMASRAVKYWQTAAGGGLWAAGVGGPATGKGFHLGIIDDPIKDAQEAQSATIRERQKDWYGSVWSTREEPSGAQVVVQTRWHQDDLSGYILELEQDEPEHWYIVSLAAIAEPPASFPDSCTVHPDWREEGEALCPERYPIARLKNIAKRIGSYFFGALFQQRPTPRDGGMFSNSVEIIDSLPARPIARVRYWDKSGAEASGDYTVGALLALLPDQRIVIEDVERFQLGPAKRNERIKEIAELDRSRGRVVHWIEQPPGDGVEATQNIIRFLSGFSVFADPVRGDKVERADPLAAQWQAGNVLLMRGAWNKAFIEEMRAFPHGANDDQVDAASGAFNKLFLQSGVGTASVGGQRQQLKGFKVR